MGSPTGFLEFRRALPGRESPAERVKHFREFEERYIPEALHGQAARCMNCSTPFCHHGCPLGNVIPEFNDAVFNRQWEEAYQILSSTNNFPEFTGRICPAPCESACVLAINQPAVTIEEIEKHIIEIAFEKGLVKPRIPRIRTGKKVAVVGSGPAGLAVAAQLNAAGHQVTVFEKDDLPGGLLRYGIPDFKLEKWVVDRRIAVLEEEGIQFRCNARVGSGIPVSDLLRDFHAIVLAGGSAVPRDLPVPGRNLGGIHFAMDYLTQQNHRVRGKEVEGPDILAFGKDVIVIGGGDTGSDCVGTANRQGARSVTQFELLPRPPASRTQHMPWPGYPMILKTSSSHEEGVERHWAVTTKAFQGDGQGVVSGLELASLEWTHSEDGRPARFTEIPGSGREIPAQLVLLAMGFLHPVHTGLIEELGVEKDEKGNVRADEKEFQTSVSRIFSAGDMRRGQSLVVWAISEGRECARKVDEFLMGSSNLESKDHSRLELT